MYPSRFRYESPTSIAEALDLLHQGQGEAKVLAGGQSLIPLLKLRFAAPELVVDINNLPGLDYHREILPGLRATYQSSSIHAQLRATLQGVGLCVLPHFMASGHADLVPVLTRDIYLERDYWCVSHQDLSATPRIRALAEFVKQEARAAEQLFLGDALIGK